MSAGRWHHAVDIADLEEGDVTRVRIRAKAIAIYDCTDGLYATAARCSHHAAELVDGYLDGHTIECPLHQGCFDVRTGVAIERPATRALATYPVRRTDDGRVEVQLPPTPGQEPSPTAHHMRDPDK